MDEMDKLKGRIEALEEKHEKRSRSLQKIVSVIIALALWYLLYKYAQSYLY